MRAAVQELTEEQILDANLRFWARASLRNRMPWVRDWTFTIYDVPQICHVVSAHSKDLAVSFRAVIPIGQNPREYCERAAAACRADNAATLPPLRLVSAQ